MLEEEDEEEEEESHGIWVRRAETQAEAQGDAWVM